MRRLRRSHRSGSRKRKTLWSVGQQWGSTNFFMANATVNTSWAWWPAGTVDDSNDVVDFDFVAPRDHTLVRSVFSGFCYANAPSLDVFNIVLGFGLIAWDSVNPEVEHKQNAVTLDQPSPFFGGSLDWVHRILVPGKIEGNVGFSTDLVATGMDMSDSRLQSRAQRKLSDGTGLLMCFDLMCLNRDLDQSVTLNYFFEYRMLLKEP